MDLVDAISSVVNTHNAASLKKIQELEASNKKLTQALRRAGAEANDLDEKLDEATKTNAALQFQRDELFERLKAVDALVDRFKSIDASEEIANERMNSRWVASFAKRAEENLKKTITEHAAAIRGYEATINGHKATIRGHKATIDRHEAVAAARATQLADLEAQLATAQMRLRDKEELDMLSRRGDLEAVKEQFRRMPRNSTADLDELGLKAREDDEEAMSEDF